MERGWQLFEHGRAVSNGRGGMQRTVFKAHPRSKIPEWDGKNLRGKRLLINGEQGIGDVMMFTMLISPLFDEAQSIGIITYDRLTTLYKRAFPQAQIYDANDLKKGRIDPQGWDLQVAMGSLPMLRYTKLNDYKNLKPFLKIDHNQKDEFSKRFKNIIKNNKLIGFSWKGGGNAKQKRTKSLQLDDMLPLFKQPGTTWISLQYGDVSEDILKFNQMHNLNLLMAEDVDPLKDMDKWCALVSCCDKVISAANTTIHGAGCLGIPTTVILAKEPDWRWLGDHESECYWYPTVSIARQREVGSWKEPIANIVQSMRDGSQSW